jgi:hypothetical protein
MDKESLLWSLEPAKTCDQFNTQQNCISTSGRAKSSRFRMCGWFGTLLASHDANGAAVLIAGWIGRSLEFG